MPTSFPGNADKEHIHTLLSHILHSDHSLFTLHHLNAENSLSDYFLTSPKDEVFNENRRDAQGRS